ncbi:MAG TPA: hypothetical protein VHE14_09230 [Solirubrobacteraceae bacterium]|nr:hypothetical protein [Solirubrobacteraceae bacterium]
MTDANAQVFMIVFQIAGARAPDEYARRAYDDDELQDMMLGGPDDAGVFDADFEREGDSFPIAVLSAIRDIQRVFPEATMLRVEPDDLVTIAAIAERVGRSHESVRLLARGRRGPGGFPAAAGKLDAKTQVWRWSEVAQWFEDNVGRIAGGAHAAFLAAVNDVLDLRRVAGDALEQPGVAEAVAALLPEQLTVAVHSAA